MGRLLLLGILVTALGCSNHVHFNGTTTGALSPDTVSEEVPSPSPAAEPPEYPGKTIEQIFPITAAISSIDDDGPEAENDLSVAGHIMRIEHYVPKTLNKDGRRKFEFKKRQPDGYWGTVVGVSRLRGVETREIYAAVSGPGGVCCTNYSIVDISSEPPRSLFDSEDFGHFRDPMEIFDGDDDGVYELVQFDSCMRYFMGDCGSCSPEPRVHFKYDRLRGKYLPAARIQQDFAREARSRTEKWIKDEFEKWKASGDRGTRLDLDRSLRGHVADLLHIGEEQHAWTILEKYSDSKYLGRVRAEIRKRLKDCKFYQALPKTAGERER